MNNKPLIVCVLGKAGAGKGTQVSLIRERLGLEYLGSGEMLRARKQQADFTGKKIAECIDNGGLVLTPVIFSLWMKELERIKSIENVKGILFDGSPRKILEAKLLDEAVSWYDWDNDLKVILIDISDEEAVKRIAERAKIEGREDDEVEALKKRLGWFKDEVVPVLDYYEEKGKLVKINGEQSVEEVYSEIIQKLGL
ncbi:MAG: nucleoside monophosphate kinase [Candidatus Pacebacteria bacterium]|nr:nucleoside monophosphate kinase [Candidatus Paceibacterota bacterium]MDD3919072.1 nucleoside monophosphate kinase [Candidatus Paceibacterota bacterium]